MSGQVVLTSGYVSMDHMIEISTPARVGYTSIITNSSCTRTYFGGCSVNIAYALSKLGVPAKPILRVGDDWERTGFRSFLEEAGVGLDAIAVVPGEATSASYLIQDAEGQHITCYYPGPMAPEHFRPLDDELFSDVALGVITVASERDNREFFEKCRTHGIPVAFGMKADEGAFPLPFPEELLRGSEIVFANESERRCIERALGLPSMEDLLSDEVRTIVTTYGPRGSAWCHRESDGSVSRGSVGVVPCGAVVDTTGCGDAYMSGFLYGWAHGKGPGECCRLGATLSSFVLERYGCCTGVPGEEELLARLEERRGEVGRMRGQACRHCI